MNSNLYNNQNIGDNKSLISHPEKNEKYHYYSIFISY